jgi:hypothetical protein
VDLPQSITGFDRIIFFWCITTTPRSCAAQKNGLPPVKIVPSHQKIVYCTGSDVLFDKKRNNLLLFLIVKGFENTFFCLEDFAFGTAPGVRETLKRCTGRYPVFGISFHGIIDIMTLKTYKANHFL